MIVTVEEKSITFRANWNTYQNWITTQNTIMLKKWVAIATVVGKKSTNYNASTSVQLRMAWIYFSFDWIKTFLNVDKMAKNHIRTEKYLSSERVPMNKTIQNHWWSERFQFFFWSGAVPIFKWISVMIFKASLQISCVFLFSLYFSMTSSSAANRSAYTIEEKANSQYLTECVENYRKTEKTHFVCTNVVHNFNQ